MSLQHPRHPNSVNRELPIIRCCSQGWGVVIMMVILGVHSPVFAQIEFNVPEENLEGYELIYKLDIPVVGNFGSRDIPYSIDRSADLNQPFDRVAYYLELKKPDEETQFMFVSGDAFDRRISRIAVPRRVNNIARAFENMTVITNVESIQGGEGLTGHLEFFNTNYGGHNRKNVPNATSHYDFGDDPSSNQNGHGCLQIHHPENSQVLFAYNRFNYDSRSETGIGNSPPPHIDWTNKQNADQYEIRRLEIYVRPGEPTLPVPNTISVNDPLSCRIVQRWPANDGRIFVKGRLTSDAETVQARLVDEDGVAGTEWITIDDQIVDRWFVGYITGPAGWYQLELRGLSEGVTIETGSVDDVGIGEIFIMAGDSTSANYSETKLTSTTGKVCAKVSNKPWQVAGDPLPGGSGSLGSPWTAFADRIVERFNVPVGLYSVGLNDARVAYWQRGHSKNLYTRLRNAVVDVGANGARGIIWQQGYNDAIIKTTQEQYERRLLDVIEQIRADEGWMVPWWLAQSAYSKNISDDTCRPAPECENINNVLQCVDRMRCDSMDAILDGQRQLAASTPQVTLGPDTEDLIGAKWRPSGVNYSEAGQLEVGLRWGNAIQLPQCRNLPGVVDEWFCRDGQPVVGCPPRGPIAETCNGVDDDCDGRIDESTERVVQCGAGACLRDGVDRCIDGEFQTECTPGTESDESCDGLDNDCDGSTDEGIESDDQECGVGACASTGPTACIGGQVTGLCEPKMPTEESCDGLDNDCDGTTDEAIEMKETVCGVGACASTGTATCNEGDWADACAPLEPQPEACDGIDNDCDGLVDNVGTKTVECGVGFCRVNGVEVCEDGETKAICTPTEPIPEICDGLDNDCDGESDEGLMDESTVCGIGQCRQNGVWTCMAGTLINTCVPGEPSTEENCDGLDEDCDGVADEGLDCTSNIPLASNETSNAGEMQSQDGTPTDEMAGGNSGQSANTETQTSSGGSGGCSIHSDEPSSLPLSLLILMMAGLANRRRYSSQALDSPDNQ